jgi:hypothetical protein
VVIGGLGLLGVAAIAAGVWVLTGPSRPAAARMNPAIIASLATQGYNVTELPPDTSVQITGAQANAIYHTEFPNRPEVITTAFLAKVTVPLNPASNCTCWLVTWLMGTGVPPQGGPPGGKLPASQFTSLMRYHVTFVDANSGKFYVAVESYYPLHPSPGASP